MRRSLITLATRVNAFVDWFIPANLKSSDYLVNIRMFLFSHMFGPFLGHTISFSMLYIDGGADRSWWIFFLAVTAFWPFPLLLRFTGWYVPLSLLSIQNLMFCIFWGCYQYGGASSPIMPWLVTVPLLAFFYLPGRTTRIEVGFLIVANLVVFYSLYGVFGFPERVALNLLVALGLISTFCAAVYVSMMALYYASIVSSQAELEQEVQLRRATEEKLREATTQIERAMRAKSEFLAKMSHELRNPLNSIIGYSEILIGDVASAESQKYKDLFFIKSAGHQLLELIDDLLDLSRLEAGRMKEETETVEVRNLFDGIAAQWRPVAVANGNELRLEQPAAQTIICDATKLRRVVDSLLSNAAKYTKNGRVTLSASIHNGILTASIADTGPGIAADRIDALFDTFVHAKDETASKYADVARLGLPLAHRFCRLIGGKISVQSEVGVGTCFTVEVPVAPVVEGQSTSLAAQMVPQAA
jgi:signal transduction histidine kinase